MKCYAWLIWNFNIKNVYIVFNPREINLIQQNILCHNYASFQCKHTADIICIRKHKQNGFIICLNEEILLTIIEAHNEIHEQTHNG